MGKTRLARWYSPFEHEEKEALQDEVHKMMRRRPQNKFTSFVEFRTYKLIYRKYCNLFFAVCVDVNDNELAYLEIIHLFVELLDKYFVRVSELDLVKGFHRLYTITDEIFLAGEIQDTSKAVIMSRLEMLTKLDDQQDSGRSSFF